jgi:hypothetical protein
MQGYLTSSANIPFVMEFIYESNLEERAASICEGLMKREVQFPRQEQCLFFATALQTHLTTLGRET